MLQALLVVALDLHRSVKWRAAVQPKAPSMRTCGAIIKGFFQTKTQKSV
jgi:hypothetical protein